MLNKFPTDKQAFIVKFKQNETSNDKTSDRV